MLLGEFHGNEQGPEALWMLSERIVGPITFALEYAESDDPIFHSWINSDGTGDDRRNLLKARFWSSSGMYDGRSSVAMYRLLERIRKARQHGADLKVLGVVRLNSGPGSHDQRMAESVLNHRRAFPNRAILGLMGNLHVGLREIDIGQGAQRSMAQFIADHATLTSVRVNCKGGFSWCCTERGEELVELHDNHQTLGVHASDAGDFDFVWIVEAAVPSQRWDGTNH